MLYYDKYIKYKKKYYKLKGGTTPEILFMFKLKSFELKSPDKCEHSYFFKESINKEYTEIKERETILNNLKTILRLLNKIKVSQDIKTEIQQHLYSYSHGFRKEIQDNSNSQEIQNNSQEIQNNSQEIQNNSQDSQDNSQYIQDNSQEIQNNSQEIQNNSQEIQNNSQDILLIEKLQNYIYPLIDNFLKKKFNYKNLFVELYNLIIDNNKDYFNILNEWIKKNNNQMQEEFQKMIKINNDSETVITENLNLIMHGPKTHLKNIPCIKYNNNIFVLLYSESEKYIGSVIYYIVNNDLYFISIYKSCINDCTTCSKENSFSYKMIYKIEEIGKKIKINSIRTCMETEGMAKLLQNNGFFKRKITCDCVDYKPYNIKILKEFELIDDNYLKQNIKYLSDSQIYNNIIRINNIINDINYNIAEIVGISNSPLSLGSTDKNHIIELINTNLLYFKFFMDEENKDQFPIFKRSNVIKTIILAAVKNDGRAIEYIPTELLDFNIALEAVTNEGDTLKFVPKELRNDFIIALAAVKNNGSAIKHVPYQLKNNKRFILQAVKNNPSVFTYLDKQFINKRIALKAVRINGSFLEYVPTHLIDYKIALSAVENYQFALKFVPKTLSNYFTIALVAVYNKPSALKFVDKDLKDYYKIELVAKQAEKNTNPWK